MLRLRSVENFEGCGCGRLKFSRGSVAVGWKFRGAVGNIFSRGWKFRKARLEKFCRAFGNFSRGLVTGFCWRNVIHDFSSAKCFMFTPFFTAPVNFFQFLLANKKQSKAWHTEDSFLPYHGIYLIFYHQFITLYCACCHEWWMWFMSKKNKSTIYDLIWLPNQLTVND